MLLLGVHTLQLSTGRATHGDLYPRVSIDALGACPQ